MAAKAFVDTNVFVYSVDQDEPRKRRHAIELLQRAQPGELIISAQILEEFYNAATRRLRTPLSEPDAAEAVTGLAALDTVVIDSEVVLRAIDISRRERLSLWDALVVRAAEVGSCERLLSEDLSDGHTYGSVTVENPFRHLASERA